MPDTTPRKLSPVKFVIGVLCFVAVIGGSISLGLFLRGGPPQAAPPPSFVGGALFFVLGVIVLLAGIALYAVALATACFTFDFSKPVFKAFGVKLWVTNLLVGLFVPMGLAFMAMPMLYPALLNVLPDQIALMVSMFGPFVATQLFMVWFVLWAPLPPILVGRRLRARGIADEQLASGRVVGTSDPNRNSLKKLGMIEQDVGVLWISDDKLVFWGDQAAWEIPRESVREIERKADAGAVSAYFGAVHVILRFNDPAGNEQRVRLHAEGDWTQTASAKSLNAMADRLNAWLEQPRAGWVSRPSGFAVQTG
jgi:hypothetical protein